MKYELLSLALGLCLAFAGCVQAGDSAGPEDSESASACAESVQALAQCERSYEQLEYYLRRERMAATLVRESQGRINRMRSGPGAIDSCYGSEETGSGDTIMAFRARYERVDDQVVMVSLERDLGEPHPPTEACLRPPLSRLGDSIGAHWGEDGPQAVVVELQWVGGVLTNTIRVE